MHTAAEQVSREILRTLLDTTLRNVTPWSNRDLCMILTQLYSTPLELEIETLATRSRISQIEASEAIARCDCHTFGDALSKSSASRDLLLLIKTYAKASLTVEKDLPIEVARVLYISAIARARERGLRAISTLSEDSVVREARRCLTFGWIPEPYKDFLRFDTVAECEE